MNKFRRPRIFWVSSLLALVAVVAVALRVWGADGGNELPGTHFAISAATVISPTTVQVAFVNPNSNLTSVDASKWHIDTNGGGSSPLTATNAAITSAGTPWTITLTFAPSPTWHSSTTFSASLGLYADALGVSTAIGSNTVYTHSQSVAIGDGQGPVVSSARITGVNTITVLWSENVTSFSGDYINLVLAGGGARNVTDATDDGTAVSVLTFDGAPATVDETATMDIDNGVADLSDNFNYSAWITGQAVAAGQRPTLASAKITAANTATLVYSEPVATVAGDYSSLVLASGGARSVTGVSGSGSATILLTFSGAAAASGDTATVNVAASVLDTSPQTNALVPLTSQAVSDGQKPTLTSAAITGPNAITLVYSEPVATVAGDYSSLVLASGGARSVTGVSGSGSATILLTFSGDAAAYTETATMNIAATVADTSASANALAALTSRAVADGQEDPVYVPTGGGSGGSTSMPSFAEPLPPAPDPTPAELPPAATSTPPIAPSPIEPALPDNLPETPAALPQEPAAPAAQGPISAADAPPVPPAVAGQLQQLANVTVDLHVWSVGAEVRALQQFLNGYGFMLATTSYGSPGHETSFFGPRTRAALARFQASVGISPAQGFLGPITRAFLKLLHVQGF